MTLTLDEIAIKHGTDKATKHPIGAHGYTPHYARIFEACRDWHLRILEIGVGGGESIRTWLEYFPNAQVFGVDIVQDTNPWNSVSSQPDPRYRFAHVNQGDGKEWDAFAREHGEELDIVIDDGSHYAKDVIYSFLSLWPRLNRGGCYCIEDLACSYGGHPFTEKGHPTHMDWIKLRLDDINREKAIASLYFTKELAIFEKA